MFEPALFARAVALVADCAARGIAIATAESCTGGLVGALLTEVAGSSAVFDFGFVTYSNAAKRDLLGVPDDLLSRYGAVSSQVAEAMARGAQARSGAAMAVSITGIAGPGGGSPAKPVGLVHFGLILSSGSCLVAERRFGDLGRGQVRQAALQQALSLLEEGVRLQVGSPAGNAGRDARTELPGRP